MKKVARLRIPPEENQSGSSNNEQQVSVRTTGRIKKPKAVFDPSDNYLPRSQRVVSTNTSVTNISHTVPAGDRKKDTQSQNTQGSNKRRHSASSVASFSSNSTLPPEASVMCYVCLKREAKRSNNYKKLISCLDCDKKVHKLCIKIEFENFDIVRQNYKCEDCRVCDTCDAFSDTEVKSNDDLITCAKCVKSYHLHCHIPNVLSFEKNKTNWKCNKCTNTHIGNGTDLTEKDINNIIGNEAKLRVVQLSTKTSSLSEDTKVLSTKRSSTEEKKVNSSNGNQQTVDFKDGSKKVKYGNGNSEEVDINSIATLKYSPTEPDEVPDVKGWSVEQVADYIAKYFPNEASVFRDHEIDGTSLLLLKRSDVIKKLPIKLGPSLRIYSLILKIQSQQNDATLGWTC